MNNLINNYLEHLPIITYGKNKIRKSNISSFFKKLTNIDQQLVNSYSETQKIEFEKIEKLIFCDINLSLSFYSYFHNIQKGNFLKKFLKFLYQPIYYIRVYYNDRKYVDEITRMLGISTYSEALDLIKEINKKVNDYLGTFGESYCSQIENR